MSVCPLYIWTPWYICMTPYPLHICMFCVPHMSWDLGASVHPICLGVFWGTTVHLWGILVSVSTPICFSVHNSHASFSPSLWVASLLDWIPMDVCYVSCCCSFLCSFHYVSSFYYHGYDYYFSGDCCVFFYVISSLSGYHGPLLDGASSNIRLAWCGSATTTDTKALWKCCWPCHCAAAATSISDASSGLCHLCHGSSTGRFLFLSWASHHFICLVSFLVYAFCFQVLCWMPYSPLGSLPLGFAPLQPFGAYLWQAYVQPGDGHQPNQVCTELLLPPLFWVWRALCYSSSCSPEIPTKWWGIQLWGLSRESPNPSAFPAWWGRVFLSRFGSIQWHGWLWTCSRH